MKKMIRLNLFIFLIFILGSSFASASADITYIFNVDNVRVVIYDCYDSECLDVSSNPWFDKSTSSGSLTVSYPSQLRAQHGYAVYYYSSGYIPWEFTANWYGNGETDYIINFEKVPICYAPVDNFYVINDAYANEPLSLTATASVGADVHSAFSEKTRVVEFIPPQFIDEHYSADTIARLVIVNSSGTTVHTDMIDMTMAGGDPLFMDEIREIEFTWTPTANGTYTAQITSEVTDNQCASNKLQSSSKTFDVLPDRPLNECYTLLNNLVASNILLDAEDTINFTVDKTSNYADINGFLTPIPTRIQWDITNLNTSITQTFIDNINANPDVISPVKIMKTWTPQSPGDHRISLKGEGNHVLCSGLQNYEDTISMTLVVKKVTPLCTDSDDDGYDVEGGECGTIDCDDDDPDVNPGVIEIPYNSVDDDCDGFDIVDVDEDGYDFTVDCNDNDASINPGAAEICDGVDNDCDGLIDEGYVCGPMCIDEDGDGFNVSGGVCGPIDCDDNNELVYPGASETSSCGDNDCLGTKTRICQDDGTFTSWTECSSFGDICGKTEYEYGCPWGVEAGDDTGIKLTTFECNSVGTCQSKTGTWQVDEECSIDEFCFWDGLDKQDENYFCAGVPQVCTDNDGDGFNVTGGVCGPVDCDDSDVLIYSGAAENCNGLDDNCDGLIDEDFDNLGNNCIIGLGECESEGVLVCTTDGTGTECNAIPIQPVNEVCDGLDNDCDGIIDNGVLLDFFRDFDGDLFGNASNFILACILPSGYVTDNLDCNDNNPLINPDTTEICDGIDNNCNALVDEGDVCIPICADNDGDGFNVSGGVCGPVDCDDNDILIHPGAVEIPNDGIDQDCDGSDLIITDEDVVVQISAYPTTGRAPLQVFFNALVNSGDEPFTYYWDFGDTHVSSLKSPKHVFIGEEVYTVTLSVVDVDGDVGTATTTIDTRQDHVLDSRDSVYVASVIPLNSHRVLAGDMLSISVSFRNDADKKLDDISIISSIPELGIASNAKESSLKSGKTINRNLVLRIPYWAAPGNYYLRTSFSANSGEVKRTVYREIKIIN